MEQAHHTFVDRISRGASKTARLIPGAVEGRLLRHEARLTFERLLSEPQAITALRGNRSAGFGVTATRQESFASPPTKNPHINIQLGKAQALINSK